MHLTYWETFNDAGIRRAVANSPRLLERFDRHGIFSASYELGGERPQQDPDEDPDEDPQG